MRFIQTPAFIYSLQWPFSILSIFTPPLPHNDTLNFAIRWEAKLISAFWYRPSPQAFKDAIFANAFQPSSSSSSETCSCRQVAAEISVRNVISEAATQNNLVLNGHSSCDIPTCQLSKSDENVSMTHTIQWWLFNKLAPSINNTDQFMHRCFMHTFLFVYCTVYLHNATKCIS